MKLRFNSFDIICAVTELQSLIGLRVNQIYDIDNKTFLIRLHGGGDEKKILLVESGIRFHTTAFEWPKNMTPSGFSMKLRKHLKNKRLEKLHQLGVDRVVDFQFGIGEAAYHVIVELYDRGNIVLTDHEMTILYILRAHSEADARFAVREKYPSERVKKETFLPSDNELIDSLTIAKHGESLNRIIMSIVSCGPTVIEHILRKHKLNNCIISRTTERKEDDDVECEKSKTKKRRKHNELNTRQFNIDSDFSCLKLAIQDMLQMMEEAKRIVSRGFIIQKKEEKPSSEPGKEIEYFYQNIEYNPYNFCQYEGLPTTKFETFMLAVDEFYSNLEGQKIDTKAMQHEWKAFKKLLTVKKDHARRIEYLNKVQEGDKLKAELITMNQALVDNAILAIRSAIASQMSWPDINELVKAAQANRDPAALAIHQLKLGTNHISLKLFDPYDGTGSEIDIKEINDRDIIVDVDLALSALANARRYYDQKRTAAQKEQKTIDASQKALKSAEKKTQEALKNVQAISHISKARKVYWFEKFYWFISSENYLVIGGRDAQQNEIIVKRYMRSNDIYVHAEIQGASSIVVRNPTAADVPPKTLLEAGTMAISYSVAWDAKVVVNAYWVRSDQVSKTAPTGEYLGTGSFMIRGKKNFLPSSHLAMGLSLLFKLEDSFIEMHRGERKVRSFEENQEQVENQLKTMSLGSENLDDILDVELKQRQSNEEDNSIERNYNEKIEPVLDFPDTQVKVEHDIRLNVLKSNEQNDDTKTLVCEKQEEATIIAAALPRKKQTSGKKQKEDKFHKCHKNQNSVLQEQHSMGDNQNKNKLQSAKRGQKGKLKKIKAKYKDQDEEERQLRMQILKSAGKICEGSADLKVDKECSIIKNEVNQSNHQKQKLYVDLEDVDDVYTSADVEIIDSLTGQPFEHDELLFVIPVVAPYQALHNYKYKVKLVPGTGKRGRAAKTALTMFCNDKMCTSREKYLLKSLRDEALARNIPGKVKLSAPHLKKLKN